MMYTRLYQSLYLTKLKHTSFLLNNTRHCSTIAKEKKIPIIEKWKRYWEDLIKDYFDVCKETYDDCKNNPKRTIAFSALCTFALVCLKTNPNLIDYRNHVVDCSNTVNLVGKPIRNPKVDNFLTSLESCYNFGVLRRFSFGMFSVVWIDNYSNELGIFKTTCSYLKPEYKNFSSRIIDIGFLGKWWRLESIIKDYDINEEEWANSNSKEDTL